MRGEIALPVGADARARCMLSPFSTVTGRNAPKSSEFIFAYPAWLRSLVRPAPGRGIASVDWCAQEHGLAAALSRDAHMMRAYQTGDPYLALAIDSGRAPAGCDEGDPRSDQGDLQGGLVSRELRDEGAHTRTAARLRRARGARAARPPPTRLPAVLGVVRRRR